MVERRPDLHVHLLIWDVSLVFGPSRTLDQMFDDWQAHPRIHFHLDGRHPFVAAHHEKIVCVDDALAFCGGIDLTVKRWDTPEHAPADPRRTDAHDGPYSAVHDLQMAVGGEAARAVAELARIHWADAVGEPLEPCSAGADPWPPTLTHWLTDVPVGIARTRAATGEAPGVHEVAALNARALAAARRSVYIEAQYLGARPVADRLVELLERPDGPEIVILVWRQATGWIERFAMGSNRDRLLRRLAAADRSGRLRAYWLAAAHEPECEINLHAKLILVDDVFVRIGSSNLNNRSLGFDSECDLAIEASDPATRTAISRFRDTLLAEHLARTPEEGRARGRRPWPDRSDRAAQPRQGAAAGIPDRSGRRPADALPGNGAARSGGAAEPRLSPADAAAHPDSGLVPGVGSSCSIRSVIARPRGGRGDPNIPAFPGLLHALRALAMTIRSRRAFLRR